MLIVYSDGGSRPSRGRRACGWGVVAVREGKIVFRSSTFGGEGTNNDAEWRGLIAAARAAVHLGDERVELRSDSELVLKQAMGEYKTRNPRMKALKSEFAGVPLWNPRLTWVKGHSGDAGNELADALATEAIESGKSWMEWAPA